MTHEEIREKLSHVRCFLLDMDGTFYLGDQLIDGSLDFLDALERTGRTARFLTNNSSKSSLVYQQKLRKMQVGEKYTDVITSGHATARYCLNAFPGKKGFLMGNSMLREELEGRGNLPVEIILQICQVLAKRDAGFPSYRDSVLQMCKNYLD